MNLSTKGRTTGYILACALGLMVGLVACAAWAAEPTVIDWGFENPANPSTSVGAGASAEVAPGAFSMGWNFEPPGLDGANGCWDLGQSGQILVRLAGFDTDAARNVSVKITQYLDGAIYKEYAQVSYPGAGAAGIEATPVEGAMIGLWVTEETRWNVPAGVAGEEILIQGSSNGSVISGVTVEIASSSVDPVYLVIELIPPGSELNVSWPVAGGEGTVQSTTNLADEAAWQHVTGTPQLVGDRYVVTVTADENARSFRLTE